MIANQTLSLADMLGLF